MQVHQGIYTQGVKIYILCNYKQIFRLVTRMHELIRTDSIAARAISLELFDIKAT